jgi:hypothetical protein
MGDVARARAGMRASTFSAVVREVISPLKAKTPANSNGGGWRGERARRTWQGRNLLQVNGDDARLFGAPTPSSNTSQHRCTSPAAALRLRGFLGAGVELLAEDLAPGARRCAEVHRSADAYWQRDRD